MTETIPIVTYHLHTTYSDGRLTPEEVVKRAIEFKLKYICFTDHYKIPKKDWYKNFYNEEHFKKLLELKEKYKDKINISCGVEFDWLEDYKDWISSEIKKRNYDFILGSIHFLKRKSGEYSPIDHSKELNEEIAKEYGGIKQFVKEYYHQLRLLIKSNLFDCVAHFDYVKRLNINSCLFSDDEDWYKEEVIKTLNQIKESGMCMEINSAGLRLPIQEQYPSRYILKEAFKRKIPLTLGSDGHGDVAEGLKEITQLAKDIGYSSVMIFKSRKRILIEI